jgi:hypothetical protein
MRRAKQEWIYIGLAVPHGAALVRASSFAQNAMPTRVLLAGGPSAELLRMPLSQLASGAMVELDILVREETTASAWAMGGWLPQALVSSNPEAVMLALEVDDVYAAASLVALAAGYGAKVVWLPESGEDPPYLSVRAPQGGKLTAAEYASWAGAAWSALGS